MKPINYILQNQKKTKPTLLKGKKEKHTHDPHVIYWTKKRIFILNKKKQHVFQFYIYIKSHPDNIFKKACAADTFDQH